jgi:Recombination endonuclease VII
VKWSEAKALCLSTFVPDKPCKKGHSLRYTSSRTCVQCQGEFNRLPANREYVSKWHKDHHERSRLSKKRFERKRRGQINMPTRPMPEYCECCGRHRGSKNLAEDHDHDTGLFRGWLCSHCNRGIGFLSDTEAGVMKAVEYLRHVASRRLLDTGIEDD